MHPPPSPPRAQVQKAESFHKQRDSRATSSASGVVAADATLASIEVRLRELQTRLDQAKAGEAFDWDTELIAKIKNEIEVAKDEYEAAKSAK